MLLVETCHFLDQCGKIAFQKALRRNGFRTRFPASPCFRSERLPKRLRSFFRHGLCYLFACEKIEPVKGAFHVLQLYIHPRRLQRLGISSPFIMETVEFLHLHIGGRQAREITGQHGGSILRHPAVPIPEV